MQGIEQVNMKLNRKIFLDWEKLRLIYLFVLSAISIQRLLPIWPLLPLQVWIEMTVGVIITNICYTLGPIAENYYQFLGFQHPSFRYLLFFIGTAFSAVATLAYFEEIYQLYIGI